MYCILIGLAEARENKHIATTSACALEPTNGRIRIQGMLLHTMIVAVFMKATMCPQEASVRGSHMRIPWVTRAQTSAQFAHASAAGVTGSRRTVNRIASTRTVSNRTIS